MNMFSIYYLTTIRIPSEMAHSILVLNTGDAIKSLGSNFVVLAPHRKTTYKLQPPLKHEPSIVKLPSLNLIVSKLAYSRLSFLILALTFFSFAFFFLTTIKLTVRKVVLIVHEPILALLVTLSYPILRIPYIIEVHDPPPFKFFLFRAVYKTCKAIVTPSPSFKQCFKRDHVVFKKVYLLPNAFTEELFKESREDNTRCFRLTLNLPRDLIICTYSGQLTSRKNPTFIVRAVAELEAPIRDKLFLLFVGGNIEEIRRLKAYCTKLGVNNVLFTGYVDPAIFPLYLKASDILLLPPGSHYRDGGMPLKLFEYMATMKPVLAPNFQSIKEVIVDKVNGLLYNGEDPKDLALKITEVVKNGDLAKKIAYNAFRDALSKYTYKKRAEALLSIIQENIRA